MKATTLEIMWHGREPVLSVDCHGDRIATGGADADVKIWQLKHNDEGEPSVEFLASLSRHTKSVNVVRFSPNGEWLASASDDSAIVVWKLGDKLATPAKRMEDEEPQKEAWTAVHIMKTHEEDVYDIAWSPDSKYIVSASVDNTVHVWDVARGKSLQHIKDHKHYVQGAAWDPLGEYVATQSCDRSCRVYRVRPKKNGIIELRSHASNSKSEPVGDANAASSSSANMATDAPAPAPTEPQGEGEQQGEQAPQQQQQQPQQTRHRLYQDETVPSFFRRLSFTPDGSLLITPTGLHAVSTDNAPAAGPAEVLRDTTYVFSRANLQRPAFHLPGMDKPSVAVRCCPVFFKLPDSADEGAEPLVDLKYRMVYAVATLDAVFLYDTYQYAPFAYFANLHYAPITDMAWQEDGRALVVASQDGYCTVVRFAEGELGEAIPSPVQRPAQAEEAEPMEVDDSDACTTPPGKAASKPSSPPMSAPASANANAEPSSVPPAKAPRRITPTLLTSVAPASSAPPATPTERDGTEGTPAKKPRRIAPTLVSVAAATAAPSPATTTTSETPTTAATDKPAVRRISPILISAPAPAPSSEN